VKRGDRLRSATYQPHAIVAERDVADGLREAATAQKRVAGAASEGPMRGSSVPSSVPLRLQLAEGWWPGTG